MSIRARLFGVYSNSSRECFISTFNRSTRSTRQLDRLLSRCLLEKHGLSGLVIQHNRTLASCCLHSLRNKENFTGKRTEKLQNSTLKYFSSESPMKLQQRKEDVQDLVESTGEQEGQITVGQKVKQAGKDASYMGVLILGFGITGVLIWYVVSELLFSFSPNSVYTKALKIVKDNQSVQEAIGLPMKAYGEETSRGRRRHVSHQEYIVDGVNYMRVKFYISGSKRKATVHVDTREKSRGQFDFRYIFVELDGYPAETIIVEDKR